MARPGLKQLLADVAADKIQVIVVYKVDRLTRSLADFARIVDILDKAGASFVSVTQEALAARELLIASAGKSIEQIALETGQCRKRLSQLIRLGFMAPDLVQTLLAPEHSSAAGASRLMHIRLPLLWPDQRLLPELF